MSGRTTLTRRVQFAAAHRYRRPHWDDATNAATFGLCARPNFHGHSYTCDVSVSGPVVRETGMLVDLGLLDTVLLEEVRERFDHRNINLDVAEFDEVDGLVPTGEELARFIAERVQARLPHNVRVTRVVVAEDSTLSATYEPA
ncbi:MAG TPA: 6-carboxytetrahydropterin synthase [Gemmatimonadaceae bacterium]|nr:6-carboxytetrahydropterin synthase [Gemmatimonadaceae bacterium]